MQNYGDRIKPVNRTVFHLLLVATLVGAASAANAEARRMVAPDGRVVAQPVAQSPSIENEVVMYATSWCPRCADARQYFRQRGIAYTEYDIEDNPGARERWRAMGARGVPIIVIGERAMAGFSPERFQQFYDR